VLKGGFVNVVVILISYSYQLLVGSKDEQLIVCVCVFVCVTLLYVCNYKLR
jgi:hypothetical protein